MSLPDVKHLISKLSNPTTIAFFDELRRRKCGVTHETYLGTVTRLYDRQQALSYALYKHMPLVTGVFEIIFSYADERCRFIQKLSGDEVNRNDFTISQEIIVTPYSKCIVDIDDVVFSRRLKHEQECSCQAVRPTRPQWITATTILGRGSAMLHIVQKLIGPENSYDEIIFIHSSDRKLLARLETIRMWHVTGELILFEDTTEARLMDRLHFVDSRGDNIVVYSPFVDRVDSNGRIIQCAESMIGAYVPIDQLKLHRPEAEDNKEFMCDLNKNKLVLSTEEEDNKFLLTYSWESPAAVALIDNDDDDAEFTFYICIAPDGRVVLATRMHESQRGILCTTCAKVTLIEFNNPDQHVMSYRAPSSNQKQKKRKRSLSA